MSHGAVVWSARVAWGVALASLAAGCGYQQPDGTAGNAVLGLGAGFSCARMRDATVRCWGENGSGQLGDGTTTVRADPVTVAGLTGAAQVTAGATHACARLADGTVSCWGANDYGQLGDGTRTQRTTPTPVVGVTGVSQVAAGSQRTCAVRNDGDLWCWGQVSYPDPSTAPHVPARVPGVTNAAQVAVASTAVCVLARDGAVWCWAGDPGWGDPANPALQSQQLVQVPGLDRAVQIAVSDARACAVRGDGEVLCWNVYQLLNQSQYWATDARAALVVGVHDVTQVTTGPDFACARRTDGSVWCWGNNQYGQLGTMNANPYYYYQREMPLAVADLAHVVEVAAGARHACARTEDGMVRCWGEHFAGEASSGWFRGTGL